MGATYGFIKCSDGSHYRLYNASVSTTELELKTDATTSAFGEVPVAQSVGDALSGKTITHCTLQEASGHLLVAYVLSKTGSVKSVITSLGKTGSMDNNIQPMMVPVTIQVGDQIRAILKSGSKAAVAAVMFSSGVQQMYITDASSAGTLTLADYKTGNGLGIAGAGIGAISQIVTYGVTGSITAGAILDNQNNLRGNIVGAATTAFQTDGPTVGGMVPDLNWSLKMVVA